jgi:hypothetical protein
MWRQQVVWGHLIDDAHGPELMRAAAFWFIASAQFVFMVMVADALVSRVPTFTRFTLKWFVGTGFYLSLIWMGVLGWRIWG